MARLDRVATAVAALLIAVLGFLPIANWIPGGHPIAGWSDLFDGWWSGTGLVLGVVVLVLVFTRHVEELPGSRLLTAAEAGYQRAPAACSIAIAALALALYLVIARVVFSGKPLLIDEIAQVVQARIFASGSLVRPVPANPEFFSSSLILNLEGKLFSQFPAGAPAMLALGSLIGAEWIVIPGFAAASVLLFAALARRIEPRPGVALGATLLFAFSPFVAFMSGSFMNHITGLTWLLLGMLGLARVMEGENPRFRDGLLLGAGFGIAATVRPSDALLFALPAGIWLLARTIRTGAWQALIASGLGIVVPMLTFLGINAATTGSPLTLGYTALWGASHDVGFHTSPWGQEHTPARGLELINLYFARLQSHLFETPVPSLLPAIGALALTQRLRTFDRYLFVTAALLLGFYFAYWHDGFYIGPRFMIPLAPFLALWTARFFALLPEQVRGIRMQRAGGIAVLASAVIALTVSVPLRARQYGNGMLTMRWDADAASRQAGVAQALVLVRESWGAQLVARMWAAGVPPNVAEHQYRHSDACALEQALDRVERLRLQGPQAVAALRPLLADSARLIHSPFTTDPTSRLLPGSTYTQECLARVIQDRQGFTIFAPLLLAGRHDDLIYARDLQAHDSLLVARYPDRPVFLLRPPTAEVGAEPRFYPLSRDSLFAAWRRGE